MLPYRTNNNISLSLEERLIQKGLINQDQLQIVLKQQHLHPKPFAEILLDYGYVDPFDLLTVLSEMTGLPYVDLSQKILDSALVKLIPKEFALKHRLILMEKHFDHFDVALADPEDLLILDYLKTLLNSSLSISPFHGNPGQILSAIDLYYGDVGNVDDLKQNTIRLVHQLITQAVKMKASDIHLQPTPKEVCVRYRLDGVLIHGKTFHKDDWLPINVRLKIMSNLDIAEFRRPQSGSFSLIISNKSIDFRVSIHPTIDGENIVIRILDQEKSLMGLEQLGFTKNEQQHLHRLVQQPQGLVIVNGPTGSGKTTTLYAMLDFMDAKTRNIMTLEDPVEYRLPHIRQSEIRHQDVMSFSEGVRSILRQDPDVIFISEIRDAETAQMAVRAAMTGHLVLATLHANSNVQVPSRLKDLGINQKLLSDNLIASISQRLLRRYCKQCSGEGCLTCFETGYKDRIAIADILVFDDELKETLSQHDDGISLSSVLKKRSHPGLWEKAEQLIITNQTTAEERDRVLGKKIF